MPVPLLRAPVCCCLSVGKAITRLAVWQRTAAAGKTSVVLSSGALDPVPMAEDIILWSDREKYTAENVPSELLGGRFYKFPHQYDGPLTIEISEAPAYVHLLYDTSYFTPAFLGSSPGWTTSAPPNFHRGAPWHDGSVLGYELLLGSILISEPTTLTFNERLDHVGIVIVPEVKTISPPLSGESAQTSARACPEGWSMSGAKCFRRFSESVTWYFARQTCLEHGADLAAPTSSAETSFLVSQGFSGWISFNDLESEGTWRLVSGGRVGAYTNWNSNEPNDSGGNEDCAETRTDGRWTDRSCTVLLAFICERPASLGCCGCVAASSLPTGANVVYESWFGDAVRTWVAPYGKGQVVVKTSSEQAAWDQTLSTLSPLSCKACISNSHSPAGSTLSSNCTCNAGYASASYRNGVVMCLPEAHVDAAGKGKPLSRIRFEEAMKRVEASTPQCRTK